MRQASGPGACVWRSTIESMTKRDEDVARLRLRPDALEWREIEGEVIALDSSAATYLAGNATATRLWRALSEGTTRASLISTLTEEFGIDAARAGADVDAFLRELRSRDLLSDR
jgi:Coenzyme PQQ synthesis protein D (PqqD)